MANDLRSWRIADMKLPILLFDPNPVAARRLAMQLRHAGFATYVTFDGSAAVSSARGRQFTSIVVIADLADFADAAVFA